MNRQRNTSWQHVSPWYKKITQDKGHYFHEHVVIPGLLKLLNLKEGADVLDLACGTGVLARSLPKNVSYVGIDIAKSFIEEAKKLDKNPGHDYILGDITKEIKAGIGARENGFSHITCILALQNVENYLAVFRNAAINIQKNGAFAIVLNHPAFRIPRQSSWGIDEQNKLQYRKVNHYLTPLKIPITMNPGARERSPITWSFHQPLSSYINGLKTAGFVVTGMEEWTSDKESEGKAGKMENRSRSEIPLFLTIIAKRMS